MHQSELVGQVDRWRVLEGVLGTQIIAGGSVHQSPADSVLRGAGAPSQPACKQRAESQLHMEHMLGVACVGITSQ